MSRVQWMGEVWEQGLWVVVLDKAWGGVGFQGVVALWGETESR